MLSFLKINILPNPFFIFSFLRPRCTPDEMAFSSFAPSSVGGPGLSGMTYLKSSPYLMAVDTLHSMGYAGEE